MPLRQSARHETTLARRRSERLQKIGSCIFLVGVPLSIMGVVFTIVAFGNGGKTQRVAEFSVAGPFLLVMSVVCFVFGLILYRMTEDNLEKCYNYFPETQSKTNLCVCVLCVLCKIVSYKTSRISYKHRRPVTINNQSVQPKSILHQAHTHREGNKLPNGHVRFDGQSVGDIPQFSLSVTSLHRHCRVHPSSSESEGGSTGSRLDLSSVDSFQTEEQHPTSRRKDKRPASASEVFPVFGVTDHTLSATSMP